MRRKALAGFLAAAMTASLLAGCGSKKTTNGGGDTAKADAGTTAASTTAAGTAAADNAKPSGTEDPKLEKNMKILSIWAEDNDNGVLIKAMCEKYQSEVNPNFTWDYERCV